MSKVRPRAARRFFRPSLEALEARSLLATGWPVPANTDGAGFTDTSHEMQFGFGAGAPNNFYHFHEGIDIRASGQGGEPVYPVRNGTVSCVDRAYAGGIVAVRIDMGPGNPPEYDAYAHMENI